jgi:hypothetical protein
VPQVPLFLQPFGAPPSEVEQLVHAIIYICSIAIKQFKFIKRLICKDSIFIKYIPIKKSQKPKLKLTFGIWNLCYFESVFFKIFKGQF